MPKYIDLQLGYAIRAGMHYKYDSVGKSYMARYELPPG